MIRTLNALLPVLVVMLALPPAGTAREFGEIYTDCGIGGLIGAAIGSDEDTIANVAAVVTNITFDLGTTAISSNITSPGTCARGKEAMAAFIFESYDSLEVDLASGHGAYLDGLASLAGHDGEARGRFVAALRSGFARLVAAPDYPLQDRFTRSEALYNLVNERSAGAAKSVQAARNG